jgi:hypothetical protein
MDTLEIQEIYKILEITCSPRPCREAGGLLR